MAAPLVRIVIDKAGRYRRNGKFVSAAAYRSQQWRLAGGKSGTALRRRKEATFGEWMNRKAGPPGAGQKWERLAKKYPDRFGDWLSEFNEEMR